MNDTHNAYDLDRAVEALPREFFPDDDLWPEIHKRIDVSRSNTYLPLMAMAASVLLMVGGMLYWPTLNSKDDGITSLSSNGILVENMFLSSVGLDMDEAFEKRRTILLSKFGEDHALTQNWKDQLGELEDARKAIKDSLEENPENFYLIKALQNIHEQQLNLIMRVHDDSWQRI